MLLNVILVVLTFRFSPQTKVYGNVVCLFPRTLVRGWVHDMFGSFALFVLFRRLKSAVMHLFYFHGLQSAGGSTMVLFSSSSLYLLRMRTLVQVLLVYAVAPDS